MQGVDLALLLEEQSPSTLKQKPLVAFVGSALSFPESLIAVANSTIDGHEFCRITDFSELLRTVKLRDEVSLFVFEEQFVPLLLTQSDDFLSICKDGRIAFAYLEQSSALNILDMRAHTDQACEISLFPLNSQLEVALSVIKLILCGRQFIPCELLLDRVRTKSVQMSDTVITTSANQSTLTDRELEVLALVSAGKQNKHVAHTLALSEHTVKLHMHHILTKLRVRNRTQASAWYIANVGDAVMEDLR